MAEMPEFERKLPEFSWNTAGIFTMKCARNHHSVSGTLNIVQVQVQVRLFIGNTCQYPNSQCGTLHVILNSS